MNVMQDLDAAVSSEASVDVTKLSALIEEGKAKELPAFMLEKAIGARDAALAKQKPPPKRSSYSDMGTRQLMVEIEKEQEKSPVDLEALSAVIEAAIEAKVPQTYLEKAISMRDAAMAEQASAAAGKAPTRKAASANSDEALSGSVVEQIEALTKMQPVTLEVISKLEGALEAAAKDPDAKLPNKVQRRAKKRVSTVQGLVARLQALTEAARVDFKEVDAAAAKQLVSECKEEELEVDALAEVEKLLARREKLDAIERDLEAAMAKLDYETKTGAKPDVIEEAVDNLADVVDKATNQGFGLKESAVLAKADALVKEQSETAVDTIKRLMDTTPVTLDVLSELEDAVQAAAEPTKNVPDKDRRDAKKHLDEMRSLVAKLEAARTDFKTFDAAAAKKLVTECKEEELEVDALAEVEKLLARREKLDAIERDLEAAMAKLDYETKTGAKPDVIEEAVDNLADVVDKAAADFQLRESAVLAKADALVKKMSETAVDTIKRLMDTTPVTLDVLSELEAILEAASKDPSMNVPEKDQRKAKSKLASKRALIERLTTLIDVARTDFKGFNSGTYEGTAAKLVTECKDEELEVDALAEVEKLLARREKLDGVERDLEAAMEKVKEAAKVASNEEALDAALGAANELVERATGEFETKDSAVLSKAHTLVKEHQDARELLGDLLCSEQPRLPELKKAIDRGQAAFVPFPLLKQAMDRFTELSARCEELRAQLKDAETREQALTTWEEENLPDDDPTYLHAREAYDRNKKTIEMLDQAQHSPVDLTVLGAAIKRAKSEDVHREYLEVAEDKYERVAKTMKQLKEAVRPQGRAPRRDEILRSITAARTQLAMNEKLTLLIHEGELKVQETDQAINDLKRLPEQFVPFDSAPPWDDLEYGSAKYKEYEEPIFAAIQEIEAATRAARAAGIVDEDEDLTKAVDLLDEFKKLKPKVLAIATELDKLDTSYTDDEFEKEEEEEAEASGPASEPGSPVKSSSKPGSPTNASPGKGSRSNSPNPNKTQKRSVKKKTTTKKFTFHVVHARKVREAPEDWVLPSLQDLEKLEKEEGEGSWLAKLQMSEEDAVTLRYRSNVLTLSHRWETPEHPDPKGVQSKTLRKHLIEHTKIQYVWVDFMCLYQGARTQAQTTVFKETLPNINLLYLGCSVLLIIDLQYMARFWTQFEAWLSFQKCTAHGIVCSPKMEQRFTIAPLYTAGEAEILRLKDMWSHATCKSAHEMLKAPDLSVTNEADKKQLLPLIFSLDERVCGAFANMNNICQPWLELKKDNDTQKSELRIYKEASTILESKQDQPLNLVAVCGQLRTGKSYLMNCLMESKVFGVSARVTSYTQGIHLSSLLLPCSRFGVGSSEVSVGFVDMEGQSDKGIEYDIKLATPLLLVSKAIILNVMCGAGPPKAEVLDKLKIMMQAAKAVKSDSARSNLFGCLHVILRDCTSTQQEAHEVIFSPETKPIDEDGEEEHDSSRKGREMRNLIRTEILEAFSEPPQTWVLHRVAVGQDMDIKDMPDYYRELGPLSNEAKWATSYIDTIDQIRATLGQQLTEPKLLDDKPLTGGLICALMPDLALALQSDDPNISPPTIFEAARARVWLRIEDDIKDRVKQQFTGLLAKLPVQRKQVEEAIAKMRELMDRAVAKETKQLGEQPDDKQYIQRIAEVFQALADDLMSRNEDAILSEKVVGISKLLQPYINLKKLDGAIDEARGMGVTSEQLADVVAQRERLDGKIKNLEAQVIARPAAIPALEEALEAVKSEGLAFEYYMAAQERLTAVTAARDDLNGLKDARPINEATMEAAIARARDVGVEPHHIEHVADTLERMRASAAALEALVTAGEINVSHLKQAVDTARRHGVLEANITDAEKKIEENRVASDSLKSALKQLGMADATECLRQALAVAKKAQVGKTLIDQAEATLAEVQAKTDGLQEALSKGQASPDDALVIAALLDVISNAGVTPRVDQALVKKATKALGPIQKKFQQALTKEMDTRPLAALVAADKSSASYEALKSAIADASKARVEASLIDRAGHILKEAEDAGAHMMTLLQTAFDGRKKATPAAKTVVATRASLPSRQRGDDRTRTSVALGDDAEGGGYVAEVGNEPAALDGANEEDDEAGAATPAEVAVVGEEAVEEEEEEDSAAVKISALKQAVTRAEAAGVATELCAAANTKLTRHDSTARALEELCKTKPIDTDALEAACKEAHAAGLDPEAVRIGEDLLSRVAAEIATLTAVLAKAVEPSDTAEFEAQVEKAKKLAGEIDEVVQAEAAIKELNSAIFALDKAKLAPGEQEALESAIKAVSDECKLVTLASKANVEDARAKLDEALVSEEALKTLLSEGEASVAGTLTEAIARAKRAGVNDELIEKANELLLKLGGEGLAALTKAMTEPLESYKAFEALIAKVQDTKISAEAVEAATAWLAKCHAAEDFVTDTLQDLMISRTASGRDLLARPPPAVGLGVAEDDGDVDALKQALAKAKVPHSGVPTANLADAEAVVEKAEAACTALEAATNPPEGIVVATLQAAIASAKRVPGVRWALFEAAEKAKNAAQSAASELHAALNRGKDLDVDALTRCMAKAEEVNLDKELIKAASGKLGKDQQAIEESLEVFLKPDATMGVADLNELNRAIKQAERMKVNPKAVQKASDFYAQLKTTLATLSKLVELQPVDVHELESTYKDAIKFKLSEVGHKPMEAAKTLLEKVQKAGRDLAGEIDRFFSTLDKSVEDEPEDEDELRGDEAVKSVVEKIEYANIVGIDLKQVATVETQVWKKFSAVMGEAAEAVNAENARDIFVVYMRVLCMRFHFLHQILSREDDPDGKNKALVAGLKEFPTLLVPSAEADSQPIAFVKRLREVLKASPMREKLAAMAQCEPADSLLRPTIEELNGKLDDLKKAQISVKLRNMLIRQLVTLTAEIPENEEQLVKLCAEMKRVLEDKSGALQDISEAKLTMLLPFIRMFASVTNQLSITSGKVHTDVRTQFLDVQQEFLWNAYHDLIACVNATIALPPMSRGDVSDVAMNNLAACWEAMYSFMIDTFMEVHSVCRDNATTWSHEKGTIKLLKGKEDEVLTAFAAAETPPGLRTNAVIYFQLRDKYLGFLVPKDGGSKHQQLFQLIHPGVGLPTKNPHASGKNMLSYSTKGSTICGNEFGVQAALIQSILDLVGCPCHSALAPLWAKTIEAKKNEFKGSAMLEALSLIWLHFGHAVLKRDWAAGSTAGQTSSIKFDAKYVEFTRTLGCEYKTFADFIRAAISLGNELAFNPSANLTVIETIGSNAKFGYKLPFAMTLYVDYLRAIREMTEKHERGPYGHAIATFKGAVSSQLQKFVQATIGAKGSHHNTDMAEEQSVNFHLDAVQAARDFCKTYTHLVMQPGCQEGKGTSLEWQLAEWNACGELVNFCAQLNISVSWLWNPRTQALKLVPMIFPFFKLKSNVTKDFTKATPAAEETNAKSHFDGILKACKSIFVVAKPYPNTEDFLLQLGRLKSYIEFSMVMPQISNAEALDRFSGDETTASGVAKMDPSDRERLSEALERYEREYGECIQKWMEGPHVPTILKAIEEMGKSTLLRKPVNQWDVTARNKLPNLLAVICFLFSLYTSDLIDKDKVRSCGDLQPLKVHIIQAIGIMNLFGMASKETTKNQLAQVLTGQGKSWVLLMSATLLAVTEKDVRILCHNEALSARDAAAAQGFIKLLCGGLPTRLAPTYAIRGMGKITFATYQQTCWNMLDSYNDGVPKRMASKQVQTRQVIESAWKFEELIDDVLKGEAKPEVRRASPALDPKKTILLVDEVDVLFGPMYGANMYPLHPFYEPTFFELQKAMYDQWEKNGSYLVPSTWKAQAQREGQFRLLATHPLFEQHVGDLTRGIVTLENAKDRERYRLEEDPDAGPHTFKVEFRNVDADGQQYWSAKDYNGYCNAFQYIWRMKQQKRNNIKGGPGRAGNLQMQLGAMSYAEVPAAFPFIFGVTGSLDTLPDKQRAVLKDKYNVRTFSYFPSFWETKEQKRLLDWNQDKLNKKNFPNVCETEEEAFAQALAMTKRLVGEERAVLIFCKDTMQLRAFQEFSSGKISEPKVLDSTDSTLQQVARRDGKGEDGEGRVWTRKDLIVDKDAGEPGVITLATAEFGRGEDFKYSPAVLEKGGGHAIQLYLTKIKADEIQVRGRVARKSDPGSYSLILSWVEIESVLGKSKELDKLRADAKIKYSSGADTAASEVYKQIDELRLSKANTIFEQQQIDAKKSEKVHAESMMLLADVRGYFNPSLQSLDPRSRDRERAKIFDHLHKIANAVRLKEETRLTEAGVITGIDLCFLMDCTSSMGSWITAAKEELFKVVASTKAAHPDARLRVAYVGYRDFGDTNRFDIKDFVEEANMEEMKTFIANSPAVGGGDLPEDVAGGLRKCHTLKWSPPSATQKAATIMIADAAGHGDKYRGSQPDSSFSIKYMEEHPDENPDANEMLVELMRKASCSFFFFKINTSTNMMLKEFETAAAAPAKEKGVTFKVCDIGGDTSLFTKMVQSSLAMAVARAR